MEYIFGTERIENMECEVLKTVGTEHTDLTGRNTIIRNYADNDITDKFLVVEKYRTAEDAEGRCYDWYIITEHYRQEDKYSPKSEGIDSSISAVEDAILELAELIGGDE